VFALRGGCKRKKKSLEYNVGVGGVSSSSSSSSKSKSNAKRSRTRHPNDNDKEGNNGGGEVQQANYQEDEKSGQEKEDDDNTSDLEDLKEMITSSDNDGLDGKAPNATRMMEIFQRYSKKVEEMDKKLKLDSHSSREGNLHSKEEEEEEKKKESQNYDDEAAAAGFDEEKFKSFFPLDAEGPKKIDLSEFQNTRSMVRTDADEALKLMWEGMKNKTEYAKRYWAENDELERRGIYTFELAKSKNEPPRPEEFEAEESFQVRDLFDGLGFISHIKSPLVQLGFMRLPHQLYQGCNYEYLSYNELEEVAVNLDRYKTGLQGVGGPREISDKDEESMKQGMQEAISRFRKGEMWAKRQVLKKERLELIDNLVDALLTQERAIEITRQKIDAIGELTPGSSQRKNSRKSRREEGKNAINDDDEEEGDQGTKASSHGISVNEEQYSNPDLSRINRDLNNGLADDKTRITQSVLQFFRRDEDLGIGAKTVAKMCVNAMDPKKNELRTMAVLLRKMHRHDYGLVHAMQHYIARFLAEDQNGLRAQRYVLEELRWFYEKDLF